MLDLQLLIIIAIIIASTLLVLSLIGLFLLIRKCLKSRRRRNQGLDIEKGGMNEKLIYNEKSPKLPKALRNDTKFLSVSLSEIPFIDEAYISTPDIRISKTCDAIYLS